jgi:cytidine deaminase
MNNKEYKFDYQRWSRWVELPAAERTLVEKAFEACGSAYAVYSNFRVGAAARLRSGVILTGANQESEVFPAGLCAERTMLFDWMAHHAADPVEVLAIASVPGHRECYPCGQCRQVLLDVERRQGSPIRIIMASDTTASVVSTARDLLPFQFEL